MSSAPDVTYLNLTVQGSVNEIINKAGTPKVQWIVQVSAYPKPTLIWYINMFTVYFIFQRN